MQEGAREQLPDLPEVIKLTNEQMGIEDPEENPDGDVGIIPEAPDNE